MSGRDENDLLNYYPDLSDEDDNECEGENARQGSQPHKIVKPNEGETKNQKTVLTAPKMFGGKAFLPPPPPPGARKYTPGPSLPVQPLPSFP